MNTWLRDSLVPGLSLVVIERGRMSWSGAFGVRNAETKEPVTPATVFEAASLSKPVFAYAVMKLVDRGALDLDTPLAQYLAGADLRTVYPPAAGGDERWKRITARMVLTHSTGFPNWFTGGRMTFLFDPGARFSYSGEAYSLLSAAASAITGQSFNDLMADLVFGPLEMRASSYVWRADYEKTFTASHDIVGRRTERGRTTQPRPGASLYTTAEDYARFLVALSSGTGLRRATWEAMTRAQIGVVDRDGKPCFSWGFGVGVQQVGEDTTIWHWGDNGDLNGYFEVVLKQQRGLVFFLNGANAHAVTPLLVRRVLGTSQPAIAASYFRYPTLDSPVMAITRAYRDRGATGAAEDAAGRVPDLIAPGSPSLQRLNAVAALALSGGDIAGARAAVDLVLKHQATPLQALVLLGGIHAASGDKAAMEGAFQRARDVMADIESRVNGIGYTLLRSDRIDGAIAVFEYNTRAFPESANAYDSLAEAYEKKGDRPRAIRNYARAVSLVYDPTGTSYQALKRLLTEK